MKKRKEEEKAKMEEEKKKQKKEEASMVIHGLFVVISETHLIAIPVATLQFLLFFIMHRRQQFSGNTSATSAQPRIPH